MTVCGLALTGNVAKTGGFSDDCGGSGCPSQPVTLCEVMAAGDRFKEIEVTPEGKRAAGNALSDVVDRYLQNPAETQPAVLGTMRLLQESLHAAPERFQRGPSTQALGFLPNSACR